MPSTDLYEWLSETDKQGYVWYVKRLSANDTLATNAHQAGPYIPKSFLFRVFPALDTTSSKNPDVWFDLVIDSHADYQRARAVYYNSKPRREGSRDEARITNLGGGRSALLDPESTGALAVFAFDQTNGPAKVWVCRDGLEEDQIEDRIGPVEPGEYTVWTPAAGAVSSLNSAAPSKCSIAADGIPAIWLSKFPSGEAIINKAIELCDCASADPDTRLLRRRKWEFELFQSIERAFHLPKIKEGFTTIESFLTLAQSVLQSRKSRSGNSLEYHLRQIFLEEGLQSMVNFEYRPVVENGKRPDYLFPSAAAYEDSQFPPGSLKMLAVKTTCKDRWRQILNEADRIPSKHLLTLQEGLSEGQFREMQEASVQLVVPAGLHGAYPSSIRPYLTTLESFIADVRLCSLG